MNWGQAFLLFAAAAGSAAPTVVSPASMTLAPTMEAASIAATAVSPASMTLAPAIDGATLEGTTAVSPAAMTLAPSMDAATLGSASPRLVIGTGGRPNRYRSDMAPGGTTRWIQRTPVWVPAAVFEIGIAPLPWTLPGGAEVDSDIPIRMLGAWFERPATGQAVAMTKDGGRTMLMPASAGQPYFETDSISAAAFTGPALGSALDGELLWLNFYAELVGINGSGQANFLSGMWANFGRVGAGSYPQAASWAFTPAADNIVLDRVGSITPPPGSVVPDVGRAMAVMVVGRFVNAQQRSLFGAGDSLMEGATDSIGQVEVLDGPGYLGRAKSSGRPIPGFNAARFGESANVADDNYAYRRAIARLHTHAIIAQGTNDVGFTGAGTPASTVLPNIRALTDIIRGELRAPADTVAATLPPRTQTTDGFSTVVNQTPYTATAPGGPADQVNDGVRGFIAEGRAERLFDLRAATGDALVPNVWRANGTPGFFTTDGDHLAPAAAISAGADLRPILDGLLAGTIEVAPAAMTLAPAIDAASLAGAGAVFAPAAMTLAPAIDQATIAAAALTVSPRPMQLAMVIAEASVQGLFAAWLPPDRVLDGSSGGRIL